MPKAQKKAAPVGTGIGLLFCLILIGAVTASGVVGADEPGAKPVSATELMAWLKKIYPPLVLDIRGSERYRKGTLPGALNAGRDPAGFLPDGKGGPVVLIVTESSDPAYLKRWTHRLRNARHDVYFLRGGMETWQRAGGRVIKPEQIYVKPGTVPFVVPRGLCEGAEPAQEYE